MMFFELEKAVEEFGAYIHAHVTVNFGEGIETRFEA